MTTLDNNSSHCEFEPLPEHSASLQKRRELSIQAVRMDGETQSRVTMDTTAASDYSEAMKAGVIFPSVTVFYDGIDYWLADGFHRVEAARLAGIETVHADIWQGTQRDARLFAIGANATHGIRRSNADKRKSVSMMLQDVEWSTWSDREIAKRCGVTHPFVAKLRTSEVVTVTTWQPMEGHCSKANDKAGNWAIVMPSSNGGFYVMVIKANENKNLEGTRKPFRAPLVSRLLSDMGFHVDSAKWITEPVGKDLDDELWDLKNHWNWPHILFDSRADWEHRRWLPDEGNDLRRGTGRLLYLEDGVIHGTS